MREHYSGPEYRTVAEIRAGDDPDRTTITFARFNVWNEIYSPWEGRFLERLLPGAFAQTFTERADQIKVLFNHGRDPSVGDKALGVPHNLRETERGPAADVEWFDRPYVADIRAGLPPAADPSVYGASYRFGVIAEEWNDEPGVSEHNPKGIPERTISQVRVAEFGPVTFPADEGTTALMGVRSLTDRFGTRTDDDLVVVDIDREDGPSEHPASAPGADTATNRADIATAFAIAQRNRRMAQTTTTGRKTKQ